MELGGLVALIALALIFDFFNGFNDSGNIVATMISTGAMAPRRALLLAASAEFVGPFLFGVAVASTIGRGVVDPSALGPGVILAALLVAIGWNLVAWYLGLPTSSSHALIGALVGAAVSKGGPGLVQLAGLTKIGAALLLAPFLGLALGFVLMKLVLLATRRATPKINNVFKRGQVATSIALALSHGTNDAQKTMGIIGMLLVIYGQADQFVVPVWVVALCAGTIALGMAVGGWRIIHTLGGKIYRIRPVHGFSAQFGATGVVLGAALLGGPVSSTHVVGSSIIGVGAAERLSKVRWTVARNIVLAWLVTLPTTALVAFALYRLVTLFRL